MGCTLGAIIVAALTFWLGWPIGTVIGVAFYDVIERALKQPNREEQKLHNEANRKIVDGE